jgi:hypothetical protein
MASPATFWMSAICSEISSVAFAVWLASDLTSEATTAKPRPASPARAADSVDETDHFADPPRGFGEPLHGAVGLARLVDRAAGDTRGMRRLLADVVDRGVQLLRSGRHAFDAHRGFAGSPLRDLDAFVGLARDLRQVGGSRAHRARGIAQLLQRLPHHGLELADMAFDRALARRGSGIALAFLRFDLELVRGLLLEGLQRTGKRADLVAAFAIAGVDVEVTVGDAQHGIAHIVQRLDDATADRRHGTRGQGDRGSEQHKLQQQRIASGGTLVHGVLLGGVEGRFGNADGCGETPNGDRRPLVRRELGLFAVRDRRNQAIAKREILRLEIGGLGRRHRGGERRWQLHSRRRQLQRTPGCFGAADQLRIDLARFRRHLAGVD